MSWETATIGTILAAPSLMAEAMDLLPSDFTGVNQPIWAEMMSLHNNGGFDARALIEALRSSQDWDRIVAETENPEEYIRSILEDRGTTLGVYISHVLDGSIRRNTQKVAALIAASAQDEQTTVPELLEYVERQVLALRRNRLNTGATMSDLLGVFLPRLDGIRAGTVRPAFTPKIQAVKNIINFAEASDFITIAARPGEGKSSFLRYEAYHHAINGGRVAIFNLENDPMEYARNFIALHSKIDSQKIRDARALSNNEMERIKTAADELAHMPIRIVTMGSPTVSQITQTARRLVAEENIDLVIVDYVQLANNGNAKKVDDVSETTQRLRGFALELSVPVLIASQLSREIERRGNNSDPQLADLRDSGSIEQDSTMVIFVRSAWNNPTPETLRTYPENVDFLSGETLLRPKAIPVRFFVEKNRNGETGRSDLVKWIKSTGDFQTLVRE